MTCWTKFNREYVLLLQCAENHSHWVTPSKSQTSPGQFLAHVEAQFAISTPSRPKISSPVKSWHHKDTIWRGKKPVLCNITPPPAFLSFARNLHRHSNDCCWHYFLWSMPEVFMLIAPINFHSRKYEMCWCSIQRSEVEKKKYSCWLCQFVGRNLF